MVNTISEGSEKSKRRIVIAGEMMELGPEEISLIAKRGARLAARQLMLFGACADWRGACRRRAGRWRDGYALFRELG